MSNDRNQSSEEDRPRLVYLQGYIEARVERGERRQYRYPENGLPKLLSKSMQLESTFITALRKASDTD